MAMKSVYMGSAGPAEQSAAQYMINSSDDGDATLIERVKRFIAISLENH
jgi:hypothetical protein